jgi:acyl dehydratase
MGGRFKSPVMPGETLEVHAWVENGSEGESVGSDGPGSERVLFQTRVGDRVVFDAGVLTRRT